MKTAKELGDSLRNREVKCVDLVDQSLSSISSLDSSVQAFLSTYDEQAKEKAATIDALLDKGDSNGPLTGVPIGIKDNIMVKGQNVTCASKILEGFIAPYNATVIDKIDQSGLVPVGRLNMDEFAMGSSTEFSAFQTTKNPWNLDCVPGGSSGGSAAAVSAQMLPLTLGSDTGGSIRQPASFCGIVGMKPTYGRVSRYGLVAFASSLDQIGPLSQTVEDSALLLNVLSGYDPKDSTSESVDAPDFCADLDKDPKGLKIGVPQIFLGDGVSTEVKRVMTESLDKLSKMGVSWEPFEFGMFDEALCVYYILAPAEASSNLERYDGVRYGFRDLEQDNLKDMIAKSRAKGFGPEVKRRIVLGTYVLSSGYYDAYYLKAQKVRTLVTKQFQSAFNKYDFIVTPTVPTLPFKCGEMVDDPISMYLSDLATIPVNLAGLPGISVPAGFSSDGLPVGLQFVGQSFKESALFNIAHQFQQSNSFLDRVPSIVSEAKA